MLPDSIIGLCRSVGSGRQMLMSAFNLAVGLKLPLKICSCMARRLRSRPISTTDLFEDVSCTLWNQ